MKALFLIAILLVAVHGGSSVPHDYTRGQVLKHLLLSGECSFEGIALHGKVKIVSWFPDIEIKVVNSFPDIKVKWVQSFPDDCGEWQVVESFPDFTIQFVESFPDLEVEFVESFPGMN